MPLLEIIKKTTNQNKLMLIRNWYKFSFMCMEQGILVIRSNSVFNLPRTTCQQSRSREDI